MGKKDPHALFDAAPDHHALFDAAPDATASAPTPAAPETPSIWEAAARGAGQGVTGSFGDEINGLIQAAGAKLFQGENRPFWDVYRQNRDTFRGEDQAAEKAHDTSYLLGNVFGGSVLTPLLPGGQAATLGQMMKVGGVLGATNALGNSQADLTTGLGSKAWDPSQYGRAGLDTAVGGTMGAGAGALGYGIQQGVQGLGGLIARKATTRALAAEQQAAQMGEAKALEEVRQGMQKSGAANADLNRQTERIRNGQAALEELGIAFTPEQQAAIKAAEAKSAQKALEQLPKSTAESDAAAQALIDLLENRSARAAEVAGQATEPTVGKDAWDLFRMYGEPVAGAALGSMAGSMLGGHSALGGSLGTLGGLIFGRTRAGKAIATRWNRPGNQLSISAGQALLGRLLGGSAPLATGIEGAVLRAPSALGAAEHYTLGVPQLAALFGQAPQSSPPDRLAGNFNLGDR